jgi:hypothetical protein
MKRPQPLPVKHVGWSGYPVSLPLLRRLPSERWARVLSFASPCFLLIHNIEIG